jgi:tetratricopeptide (TPR) repeat protein
LVIRLAHPLYLLGRFQGTLDLLLQQQESLERLQESELTGLWAFWLSHAYSYQGEHAGAEQSAQRAIVAAQHCGDEVTLGKAHYVLAREGFWLCRFQQAIVHGQQAIALLERTGEQWWLDHAYWIVGHNYGFMGEFSTALETEARAPAIGEAIGDPRIQHYAGWSRGIIHAARGDWEEGIAFCQRSLDDSKDLVNTTVALGFLGFAYLEQGDVARAMPLLEESVRQSGQLYRRAQGWFTAWLSEALLLHGQFDKAREAARQSFALNRDCQFWHGVGLARRVLGRIAQTTGAFAEAARYFQKALETFTSIHGRFEMGRTHLALAELAHAQGNRDAATMHANHAQALFMTLNAPRYVERTQQFASVCGLVLSTADALHQKSAVPR